MNNKPIFTKIMIVIVIAIICLVMTLSLAFLLGSVNANIFDFSDLNFSNMLPVILIGGFISCIIVGILVIVLAKDIFVKAKDYLFETKEDGGKK